MISRFDPLNPSGIVPIAQPAPAAGAPKVRTTPRRKTDSGKTKEPLDRVVSFFKRKGIPEENIIPHTNILTFKGWMEQGRVVRKGEHGVPYCGTRLFHYSQTKPLDEKVAPVAPGAAAAPSAPAPAPNVVPLPPMPPAPVAPPPAPVVPFPTALPPATTANIIPVQFKPSPTWRDRLFRRS